MTRRARVVRERQGPLPISHGVAEVRCRRCRGFALLAPLMVAAAATACGDIGEPQPEGASRLRAQPVALLLADYLPVAEAHRRVGRIAFDQPADHRFLTSGWHPIERDAAGESFAWVATRNAVVDLSLPRPGALRVRLDVEPFRPLEKSPSLPQQHLVVLWNGEPVDERLLGWERATLEFEVPEEIQQIGPNRMELLPRYWLRPHFLDLGDDRRELALRVFGLELLHEDRAGAGPEPAESQLTREGDAIRQPPGTVVTYYFALPDGARLRGRVSAAVSDADTGPPGAGWAFLIIRDDQGRERPLLSSEITSLRDRSHRFDEDLSDLAGRMVALSLSHAGARAAPVAAGEERPVVGDSPAVALRWEDLRIEGRSQRLALPESAAWSPRSHNVLLILFDSLRADFTEPYGATAGTTPEVRRLASQGVVFTDAYSQASWTRSSVASLLSGVYPSIHSVLHHRDRIPEGIPMLPELLRQRGYRTLAISNNPTLSPGTGFSRGFDRLHQHFLKRDEAALPEDRTPEAAASEVWEGYIEPFLNEDPEAPFFIYLHEIDPHGPYQPPAPFASLYDLGYRGRFDSRSALLHVAGASLGLDFGEPEIRYLASQYRGEVTFMDRYLGDTLGRLDGRGLREETLVIFTSDHGDEFNEHGRLGHGVTLYDEVVRVPLIFSLPGVIPAGRRSAQPSGLVDILPTVADFVGAPIPPQTQGRSLLPALLSPDAVDAPRSFFGRQRLRASVEASDSVRFGRWKLIRRGRPGVDERFGDFDLFDTHSDPDEVIDRWGGELVVGHCLRQMLAWHHFSAAPRRRLARDRRRRARPRRSRETTGAGLHPIIGYSQRVGSLVV